MGGAHRDPAAAIDALGDAMANALGGLHNMSPEQLKLDRRDKFLAMGRL
ncbi:MAG: hypothetical protein ACTHJR_10675 [Sphingomonas sp.]